MTLSGNRGFGSVVLRSDAIEQAYEFCLAYAAQGRRGEEGAPSGELRRLLERALGALDGLVETADAEFAAAPGGGEAAQAFLEVVRSDVAAAGAAIRLVLAQDAISSQLIDNLNASIHLRALLTDLFLIDECLKGGPGA
jgi:hypothetical protein